MMCYSMTDSQYWILRILHFQCIEGSDANFNAVVGQIENSFFVFTFSESSNNQSGSKEKNYFNITLKYEIA